MKLKIPAWRTIRLYLAFGLVLSVFFYMIPGFTFPPTPAHYIILGAWMLTTAIYALIGVKTNYYVIEKHGIVHHRFNKDYMYAYKDIIYIDEPYSARHKTMRFVTKSEHVYYLMFDHDGKIFDLAKQHADLLSSQDFSNRYPHIKL
ncbi:MAG TPA: hypothetical protein PK340_05215 [Bacilli bacterium]|nr:hypothetical protein [Bacilli bacterium]